MIEYELPGAKWANTDIVGEFAHKNELLKIIGGRPRGDEPVTIDIRAHLVPEPDNPYSKSGKAISVRVAGEVIGHLSEDDAKRWAPELHRVAASGATPVTSGNIYAYVKYNGEMEFNARVALPEPGFNTPLNADRLSGVAILPWGNALQVTKEEDHLDHLFDYVPPTGEGLVILTMHRMEQVLRNGTTKELVEVRLDGERVGQLTAPSSAHYLPTIRHAKDMDVELGVWTKLKGSGLAVELVIQGARATDLSDEWLREMPSIPPLVPVADFYDVPDAYVPDRLKPSSQTGRGQASDSSSTGFPRGAKNTSQFGANQVTYQVGKKMVTIGDKQRRYSPGIYKAAGICSIVVFVILAALFAGIPGVGPILSIAAIVFGIMINLGQRRIAKALELERLDEPQS